MNGLVQLFKEMGLSKSIAIASSVLVIIATLLFLSLKSANKSMLPLYGELEIEDSNKIIEELEKRNIPYELKANGTQIFVPEEKVLRLRMEMAQAGIPSKGSVVGYEIFDKSDNLGTSSFVQNINLVRALEGELSRTINAFTHIESSRVHLVIPKRELFTRDKPRDPTASVVIKMKGRNILSKDEVNAISHLVATAVPALDISKITIVDTLGRSLKLGSSNNDDPGIIAAANQDFKAAFENRLKNTLEELLERSMGVGKVKAQISADINFDRIITNSEIYDPDGQVIRSIQSIEEKENSSDRENADNVSVANNLPNRQDNQAASGSVSNVERVDATTNYEISKIVKNHISETGTIKKLSVAVLVDGNYKINKENGEMTYTPVSDEDLSKLTSLVKSAIGFDAKRGDSVEIVNMQFISDLELLKEDTPVHWLKRELPGILQTVVVGLVVILVLLLVVRPIAIRAFEITKDDLDEVEAIETINSSIEEVEAPKFEQGDESLIEIEKIEAKFKSTSNKSINDIVKKFPDETLVAIRNLIQRG